MTFEKSGANAIILASKESSKWQQYAGKDKASNYS